MTKITKEGLKENFESIQLFLVMYMNEWHAFCNEKRNGKMDIEELSILINSVISPNPWRVVLGSAEISKVVKSMEEYSSAISSYINEIKARMDENEEIVDSEK